MSTLADKIRAHVSKAFIEPARRAGATEMHVTAGDVHKDLRLESRMPAVCAAIDAQKFQDQYGVTLNGRSGPKQGATVTWIFSLSR